MIDLPAIEEGFARGEFYLEYMPTIALADGRCVGGEALARWRRPSGIVSPAQFVPLLENTPMSGRLTYWVIDRIAAELSDWLRAHPDVHVSLNVPPELLGRGGLEYAARNSGLAEFNRQIIVEITERGIPDALGLQALTLLPANGVRIALDDVTMTGANLALLSRCPFHVIKIDHANLREIVPGQPPPQWLQLFAPLLKRSDLEVIAEGIESPQQAETLRQAGIQYGQGFHFSRPLSAAGLIAFHAQRKTPTTPAPDAVVKPG
jgi:EAL domain-containing protein (putative c-di-GMP-specific phosphodiesterase class I)